MHRRSFLKTAAAGAAGLASASLLPNAVFAAPKTNLRVQLGWIANVQYCDLWIGLERGLFAKEGLTLDVNPGGPNSPDALALVAAGKTEIGYTSWLPFLDAVKMGNDFVLIAARLQKSPLGIISLAKKPILAPKDIVGSRILAQGPNERTAIEATLGLAGLPKKDWTMVPAGFSPEPLLAGDGDGYTAFATNQAVALEQMGMVREKDFFFRTFDDLGFMSYAAICFVARDYLEKNRDALVGYVRALMKAQLISEAEPTLGAKLAVEKYGVDYGLDMKQQIRQAELEMDFVRPGGDPNYPIYSLDLEKMAGPMYDGARATGRTDLPPIEKIADPTIAQDALKSL